MTKAALSAIDLGSWTLGQFQDVEEVKAALTKEIRDAVQQARAQVADEIGQQVADTVKTALKR
jgi:penicillin V acylase-like amidase (Ntn superfamily)